MNIWKADQVWWSQKTHEKRGAKIDEELEKEDEETVKAMDDHKHNQHHKHEHGKHHH